MPGWLTQADLLAHLELPTTPAPPEGGTLEVRLADAINAAVELVEERVQEFEWTAGDVPKVVRSATLLQAARLFKRSAAPFGIAAVNTVDGGSGMRITERLDADVSVLLEDWLREYATL